MDRRNALSLGMLLTAGRLVPTMWGTAEAKTGKGLLIKGAQGI